MDERYRKKNLESLTDSEKHGYKEDPLVKLVSSFFAKKEEEKTPEEKFRSLKGVLRPGPAQGASAEEIYMKDAEVTLGPDATPEEKATYIEKRKRGY